MGKLDSYAAARNLGAEWLLKQQDTDGSVGKNLGIGCYYRTPWSFAVTGHTRAALRLLEWIRNNMLAENGDFKGNFPRGGYEAGYYCYPNGNLIYGAQMLQQFDIVHRGMKFMLSMQDRKSGGFFSSLTGMGPDGSQEVWNTCQAGLTCLMAGYLPEAKKVGAFLAYMWEHQPDTQHRLHHLYTPRTGLVTDITGKTEDEIGEIMVDATQPKQWFFVPGIAAAFLTRLYQATQEPSYLELAENYIHFATRCSEDQFSRAQVGKVGWGASLLYQVTKKSEYKALAFRVGDYLLDTQFAEGYWLNTYPSVQYHNVLEVTAEFVVHLDTISAALST
jgi:hypothetical protein